MSWTPVLQAVPGAVLQGVQVVGISMLSTRKLRTEAVGGIQGIGGHESMGVTSEISRSSSKTGKKSSRICHGFVKSRTVVSNSLALQL